MSLTSISEIKVQKLKQHLKKLQSNTLRKCSLKKSKCLMKILYFKSYFEKLQ